METILKDYKTTRERTQSRDEMLKTLDMALRRSEGRSRAFRDELQDMRDENKCLKEKAQQNESILRYEKAWNFHDKRHSLHVDLSNSSFRI